MQINQVKTYILFNLLLSVSSLITAISIKPLNEIREKFPEIGYTKVRDSHYLDFTPIAITNETPEDFLMPESFILTIPQGRIWGDCGHVLIGKHLAHELVWEFSPLKDSAQARGALQSSPRIKISGRVATIAQEWGQNYYHWIFEILPRLLMLEEQQIDFDYLYVPAMTRPFQRQTFKLFNIPEEKIIQAITGSCIEVDELIVPSYVARTFFSLPTVMKKIKDRLMVLRADATFNEKIFISRRLSTYRRVINEDDLFALFEPLGFVRYDLENLSFGEQIALFNGAKVIVAPHGAGLTNILFCDPGTKIIELFQEHENMTYAHLVQTLNLEYIPVKTMEFQPDGGYKDTDIPLNIVQDVINQHLSN